MKQDVFLGDHRDLRTQGTQSDRTNVNSVNTNRSRTDLVEPGEQIDKSCFSSAARPDQRDHVAVAGAEIDPAQHGRRIIGKANIFKMNFARKLGQGRGTGSILLLLG